AIDAGHTRYAPSMGLPEFRAALAKQVHDEFGLAAGPENVVVAPGAKPFEQYFCELFLEPGDAVLVFEPAFPTYAPNIERRGARHHSPLAEPGMMERTVAAYTFSKSYSMSGWRCGFAVTAPALADLIGKMVNTTVSCAPPFVQLAGLAAVEHDAAERDQTMGE